MFKRNNGESNKSERAGKKSVKTKREPKLGPMLSPMFGTITTPFGISVMTLLVVVAVLWVVPARVPDEKISLITCLASILVGATIASAIGAVQLTQQKVTMMHFVTFAFVVVAVAVTVVAYMFELRTDFRGLQFWIMAAFLSGLYLMSFGGFRSATPRRSPTPSLVNDNVLDDSVKTSFGNSAGFGKGESRQKSWFDDSDAEEVEDSHEPSSDQDDGWSHLRDVGTSDGEDTLSRQELQEKLEAQEKLEDGKSESLLEKMMRESEGRTEEREPLVGRVF